MVVAKFMNCCVMFFCIISDVCSSIAIMILFGMSLSYLSPGIVAMLVRLSIMSSQMLLTYSTSLIQISTSTFFSCSLFRMFFGGVSYRLYTCRMFSVPLRGSVEVVGNLVCMLVLCSISSLFTT